MSERPRGRDPNRHKEEHGQLPEYRRSARFPNELTSNAAYEQARDVLYESSCDLSLYRTALLPDVVWHILVLGQTPDEVVRERIDQALVTGEAVELPDTVWAAFNQRRLEQSGQGPWVERRTRRRKLR